MAKHATAATTRTVRRFHHSDHRGEPLLRSAEIVSSPETGLSYRIERLLGEGGFGQVYLATRIGRSSMVPETVCIKVSRRIDGWLREAYFGQLLDAHPRAIRVFDAFPLVRPDGHILYSLALEYALHGDLSAFLSRTTKGWTEAAARREIAGILEVLGKLHRGQTLHRDLTPLNVFVCDGRRLKLGDFGIVRQQSDRRGITARTMNTLTAPSDILERAVPRWQARDDVYQVGQLLGMLIKGDARMRMRLPEIRRLGCTDHLKEIVYRCIGERRKRYESADEMIAALRRLGICGTDLHAFRGKQPFFTYPRRLGHELGVEVVEVGPKATELKAGVLRTLKGVHVTFTGILSRKRSEAVGAAKRAGAVVHSGPSAKTTVVVRGRPNPLQAAGKNAGLKLMEIRRLRSKGHRITLLNEQQFWRLAGGKKPARAAR